MINDYINISAIETHLDKVIRKHISKSCYAGTLPSTLKEGVMEYVVIDVVGVNDRHALGEATVNILLYAHPVSGMKNVATLSKLEKKFSYALRNDLFDSEHYQVKRETMYPSPTDYDTTYNMHYIVKAIHLTIS